MVSLYYTSLLSVLDRLHWGAVATGCNRYGGPTWTGLEQSRSGCLKFWKWKDRLRSGCPKIGVKDQTGPDFKTLPMLHCSSGSATVPVTPLNLSVPLTATLSMVSNGVTRPEFLGLHQGCNDLAYHLTFSPYLVILSRRSSYRQCLSYLTSYLA